MFDKHGILMAKAAVAFSLALGVSAIHAESSVLSDDALASSAKAALHRQSGAGIGVRVQAIDGVVYLYGAVDTYRELADVEGAVSAAVPGHKVVDSIESSPS